MKEPKIILSSSKESITLLSYIPTFFLILRILSTPSLQLPFLPSKFKEQLLLCSFHMDTFILQ